jgi:hypothetical protein
MIDFTKVRLRNESEVHQDGIELTTTTCAHYVYINFANKRITVRIPLEANDGRSATVDLEKVFDDRIEKQTLSSQVHVCKLGKILDEEGN